MSDSDGTEDLERVARIVADADVLAADLLVGDSSREALDLVRTHSWLTLVASDPLLDDAESVITTLADPGLARDWREAIESLATVVVHPDADHPGLAAADRGDAGHLLTFEDDLRGASAGLEIKHRVEVSVRSPRAFVTVFDAESIRSALFGDSDPPNGP